MTMVRFLVKPARKIVCICCLSIFILHCIVGARAVPNLNDHPEKIELLERCRYIMSKGEVLDAEWQALDPSSKMGSYHPPTWSFNEDDDLLLEQTFTVSDHDLYRNLAIRRGDLMGEKGTLNATGAPSPHVNLRVMSVSRTAYKEVYFVNVSLTLEGDSIVHYRHKGDVYQQNLGMVSKFQGLFSNRTGLFCATFCSSTSRDEPRNRIESDFYEGRRFINPAQFEYDSIHPHSESFPDFLMQRDCSIHVELKFPKSKTITTPVVVGMMKSLRASDGSDPLYFNPIHISGISQALYEYDTTVAEEVTSWWDSAKTDISPEKNLEIWSQNFPFCPRQRHYYDVFMWQTSVVWSSSCDSTEGNHCSPFLKGSRIDTAPTTMRMENIQCSPDNYGVHAEFNFRDQWQIAKLPPLESSEPLNPLTEFLLVAEGRWNVYKSQLVMVAHYFGSDGVPADTRIQITLQVPLTRSLHDRYGIVGHVRSMREASDPLYFKTFTFVGNVQVSGGQSIKYLTKGSSVPRERPKSEFQLNYIYDTKLEHLIEPFCSVDSNYLNGVYKHASFPDGSRASDFTFLSHVTGLGNSSKSESYLYLRPVTINDEFVENELNTLDYEDDDEQSNNADRFSSKTKIDISFNAHVNLAEAWDGNVAAEGWYNSVTGRLCMLGCRRRKDSLAVDIAYEEDHEESKPESESCDVVFDFQYPPTNPDLWTKDHSVVTGNISSLLDASDPFYFKPLVLNSTVSTLVYHHQQPKVGLLRRNLESIVSIGSVSLAAIFIAIQVGYSSRQSSFKSLRYVSLVMLVVLTSGHLIPLFLNCKAIWSRSLPRDMFRDVHFSWDRHRSWFSENKWLEANEVISRGTSIVALLLEMRLLQLVWTSRSVVASSSEGASYGSRVKGPTDRGVLCVCLPIYAVSIALVAIVHWESTPHHWYHSYYRNEDKMWNMIWADIDAFSGIILDLFLLPQVIANALRDTEAKVAPLHPVFYIGMTAVRSMAHVFYAAQALELIPEIHSYFLYANPNWDLYSTTWDILIPCGSAMLSTLLFFQQRYGGRCFIPKPSKWKNYHYVYDYEDVPLLDL